MASPITFSGLASGIDSTALISATSEATRNQRVKPNQTKVSELEETNTTFETLKTKLAELKTLSSKFLTLNGGGVSKSAVSSDETVLTATASNAAAKGTYQVTTISRAKNHTQSFNDRFTSGSQAIAPTINDGDPAADRTVTYTVGTGADEIDIEVEVTSTMTASQYVAAFNNASTNGGRATASLVKMADNSHAIVINTNFEGEAKGLISGVTLGASVSGVSLFTGGQQQDAATNASFSISGISGTITRSSNTVTDAIPGVTLSLQDIGTAKITIGEDAAKTTAQVQDFVDKYNEIVTFINENNKITREEDGEEVKNTFSPLASTRVDDNSLRGLQTAISGSTYSSGSLIRIFADLGIETQRDGTLEFDTDQFKTALSSEADSVNAVLSNFADTAASTNGTIDQFTRFNGLFDITINSNKTSIKNLNDRISQAEQQIARTEEQLRARFARMESLFGRLQGQQQALTSALAGL